MLLSVDDGVSGRIMSWETAFPTARSSSTVIREKKQPRGLDNSMAGIK